MLASVGGLAFLVQAYLDSLNNVCSAPLNTFAINQRNLLQRVVYCERYPVHLDFNIPLFHSDNDAFPPPGLPLFLETAE